MIGAIAGDIIGSVHEFGRTKSKEFPLFVPESTFTDDSVLTVAVARAILTDGDYQKAVREIGRRYPNAGYGGFFTGWAPLVRPEALQQLGQTARPCALVPSDSPSIRSTRSSARPPHCRVHPQPPRRYQGAQAASLAIFLARTERDKDLIRTEIASRFGYDLDRTVDGIRPAYRFDESCQRTVPEAIISFLEASSYEDAVRNAISLGATPTRSPVLRRHRRGLLRRGLARDPEQGQGDPVAGSFKDHGRFLQPIRSNRVDRFGDSIVKRSRKEGAARMFGRAHHNVYVVYLRNPNGDGKAGTMSA